jgi:hypothetical protein
MYQSSATRCWVWPSEPFNTRATECPSGRALRIVDSDEGEKVVTVPRDRPAPPGRHVLAVALLRRRIVGIPP